MLDRPAGQALSAVPEWNEICAPALIEFATRVDSELGRAGTKAGVHVIRMTIEGPDLGTEAGEQAIEQHLLEHPGARLWGALPCTPWTAMQNP